MKIFDFLAPYLKTNNLILRPFVLIDYQLFKFFLQIHYGYRNNIIESRSDDLLKDRMKILSIKYSEKQPNM